MMDNECVNPFVHRLKFRKRDYLEIFFGTIFLFPIRVVLTALLFILTSMIAKVSNHFLDKWKLEKEEETQWRNFFKKPCIFTLRIMFFIAGFYRIRVQDKGDPNAETEARILAIAPHTSPFDIICGLILNAPSVVSRHDAVDIPFFGNILKLTDPVFVQRDSQSSRKNVINSVLETIKYHRIVFFPEGTCGNRRALVQFKTGAFKPGIPVQPMALKYDQFGGPDTLSWTWDGPSALVSIWLTFCRLCTGFELVKLPVYYPSEDEKRDPELYATNVSRLLSSELNLPNLCYSFDDVRYLSYRVFRSPVCLKFLKLCDKIANQSKQSNGHIEMNGNSIHDKSEGMELSHRSNGAVPSKNTKIIPNKKQLLIDSLHKIIEETLEKIELNSPKQISSADDLISLLSLENCPEVKQSLTFKEFYDCLKKASPNPNTTHLAAVLNLCQLGEHSLWQRLENSFHLLQHNKCDDEGKQTPSESMVALLWLAFGIDNVDRDSLFIETLTFDSFKASLLKHFRSCVQQNAKELLEENSK